MAQFRIAGASFALLLASVLRAAHVDAVSLCAVADAEFRQSAFDRAAEAYRSALALDPGNARAQWGLGRIDQIQHRRQSARDRFAAAFRLNPRDPDIILSYAGFASDPAARAVLLKNFLAVASPADARIQTVAARLHIEERLGGYAAARLVSPYQPYRLKLAGFYPAGQTPSGLLLPVSINGGKPVKLLFDTGAKGIVVSRRAVRDLNLEIVAESGIGGLGTSPLKDAQIGLARTISAGDLRMEDCLVEVSASRLAEGADGVIGGDFFEQFLLRLDARARTLDLIPFDAAPAMERSIPAYRLGHLLLLPVSVDGEKERMFLLDTGSAYTAVSKEMVRPAVAGDLRRVPLTGARGEMREAFRAPGTPLRFAGRKWEDPRLVAFDLSELSRNEGVEISGMLGYSLLCKAVLTINYRDGVVEIASR